MQFVRLVEGGERARMSKRRGEFATLDELIDDIGVDAARFFMLQRSHDTALDLDLELARRQSQDNPVYYVQYAHARIASILRKAVAEGSAPPGSATAWPTRRRWSKRPRRMARSRRRPSRPSGRWSSGCSSFPAEAAGAAERRAPHRLVAYATATAADFHAFYRDCQVVGAPGRPRAGSPGDLRGGEAGHRPDPRICSGSAPPSGCRRPDRGPSDGAVRSLLDCRRSCTRRGG